MSTNFTYCKKIAGFDISIWLVMISTILISVLLVGFKILKPVELAPLTITIVGENQSARDNNEYRIGERIYLKALGAEDAVVHWDMGDGTIKDTINHLDYIYSNAGTYTVIASSAKGKQKTKATIIVLAASTQTKWT